MLQEPFLGFGVSGEQVPTASSSLGFRVWEWEPLFRFLRGICQEPLQEPVHVTGLKTLGPCGVCCDRTNPTLNPQPKTANPKPHNPIQHSNTVSSKPHNPILNVKTAHPKLHNEHPKPEAVNPKLDPEPKP